MKKTFTLILLTFVTVAHALTVDEAYKSFYNNELIDSNHCGRNIHHFLNYLEDNKVDYNSGYVVSVHEDFAMLNHFDARWGSTESYLSGLQYQRSNYYFHVFLIIDAKAYDFTQNFTENQAALDYLNKVYLPLETTENIFFQGKLTPQKVLDKHLNMKMSIYEIDGYRKNFKGELYEGSFIELFEYFKERETLSEQRVSPDFELSYADKFISELGAQYLYPSVIVDGKKMKLMADGKSICRAYGYFGVRPRKTVHEVSDNLQIYKIYTSLKSSEDNLNAENFTISFDEMSTVGGVSNQPLLHYAKSVTCTDLASVLNLLY